MKIVTSMTFFNDAIGKRLSASYSEIDDTTGQVISDNKRIDRVITDSTMINTINNIQSEVQGYIDSLE